MRSSCVQVLLLGAELPIVSSHLQGTSGTNTLFFGAGSSCSALTSYSKDATCGISTGFSTIGAYSLNLTAPTNFTLVVASNSSEGGAFNLTIGALHSLKLSNMNMNNPVACISVA